MRALIRYTQASPTAVSILNANGITFVDQLENKSVLDIALVDKRLANRPDWIQSIRYYAMSDSSEKRMRMSQLSVEVTISIEKKIRVESVCYIVALFEAFKSELREGMKKEFFETSLKANLASRGYEFSGKLVGYGKKEPTPVRLLLSYIRRKGGPVTKSEAMDLLNHCSQTTLQNYVRDSGGELFFLNATHLSSPSLFSYSEGVSDVIDDFLDEDEFNLDDIWLALGLHAPKDLDDNRISSRAEIKPYIDEYLKRRHRTDWAFEEETKCYVYQGGNSNG